MLKDADVVMLIGARLNWLLSHGKGKPWGEPPKKFIQIDIEPKEMDSQRRDRGPVVGDIGSCVRRCSMAWARTGRSRRPTGLARPCASKVRGQRRQDGAAAAEQQHPDGLSRRARRAAQIIKERPDAILVNEGANTLDFARSIIDMYKPRKRLDVGTWGVMGIGMGYAIAAAVETGKPVLAVEGDSAFGFSGMEVETICRYKLPVCIVVFNNDGIYRGTDVNWRGGDDAATTVFVKDARYDKMMEAFGGVGVHGDISGRVASRRQRGDGLRQADADQRGDRPGGRHGKRPHRQPQSAEAWWRKK